MIGKNIYEKRKQMDLTLSELAGRAKISKSYLSNIERDINKNPSIQVIKKIAMVLGVDLKELLGTEIIEETREMLDQELLDLAQELKSFGIEKEQIKDYKTLLEFIKWQNRNV